MEIEQQHQIIYNLNNPAVTSVFNGQDFIDGERLASRIAWGLVILAVMSAVVYWKLKFSR